MNVNEDKLRKDYNEMIAMLLSCNRDVIEDYYTKKGVEMPSIDYSLWDQMEKSLTLSYLLGKISALSMMFGTNGLDTISDDDYWTAVKKMRELKDAEIKTLISDDADSSPCFLSFQN